MRSARTACTASLRRSTSAICSCCRGPCTSSSVCPARPTTRLTKSPTPAGASTDSLLLSHPSSSTITDSTSTDRERRCPLIALPRSLARRFRAVLRRCAPPRTSPPPVLVQTNNKGLSLQSVLPDVAVRLVHVGQYNEATLAFPADVLAVCEGRGDDTVSLEEDSPGKGRVSWSEAGTPCTKEFVTPEPDSLSPFPEPPARFRPMGPEFLLALADASETAAREHTRYALERVLLRGKTGQMVATDGKHLLMQSGFRFPWQTDLLVPRLAVWSCPDLAREGPPSVGHTDQHVFVRVGPWTFALTADLNGRFPAFENVLPRTSPLAGSLQLGPEDIPLLLKELPRLAGDKEGPVTLELNEHITVRAQSARKESAAELQLTDSRWSGSPISVVTDRRHLLWALKLRFNEVAVVRPDVHLACRQPNRIYVWRRWGPAAAPTPTRSGASQSASVPAVTPPLNDNPTENVPMPNPNTSDRRADNGDGPTTPSDPLVEAEAIRTLLAEAQSRLARLIASLKFQRKQARAVRAAVDSLRQLPPLVP